LEVLRQIKRNTKGNILSKAIFDRYFEDNYKSIVALANPKTVLNAKYAEKDVKDMVLRAYQLINYIKDVSEASKQPAFND
jgi:hypothetical protein